MNHYAVHSIRIIKEDIDRQIEYREWLRREIKKKNPYKCCGVVSKIKSRKKEFARDIIETNRIISEHRKAVKVLTKYL